MTKKSKDSKLMYGVLIAAALVLFWYGGTHDWFKSSSQYSFASHMDSQRLDSEVQGSCSLILTPQTIFSGDVVTGRIQDGENTFCQVYGTDGSGWRLVFMGTTDSAGGLSSVQEIFLTGTFRFRAICGSCITNEATLIINELPSGDCTDTDGKNKMTAGWVTSGGMSYYDKCNADNSGVTEYWCEGDTVKSGLLMCDAGYSCYSTRSGGYCQSVGYNVGDVVGGSSGSGSLIGSQSGETIFDLSGISTGGTHYLGAKIYTNWNYESEGTCWGVQGQQGMNWAFFDSSKMAWSYADAYPQTHNVDLCPLHWDGANNWRLWFEPFMNLPDCKLNYNYNIEIYVCD